MLKCPPKLRIQWHDVFGNTFSEIYAPENLYNFFIESTMMALRFLVSEILWHSGHFFKWPPKPPRGKSGLTLYLNLLGLVWCTSVPSFMLLPQNARFTQFWSLSGWTNNADRHFDMALTTNRIEFLPSGIHVNPERSFRGTKYGPSSEARQALEGGSGGPPPEIFKNPYCKWCNRSYS